MYRKSDFGDPLGVDADLSFFKDEQMDLLVAHHRAMKEWQAEEDRREAEEAEKRAEEERRKAEEKKRVEEEKRRKAEDAKKKAEASKKTAAKGKQAEKRPAPTVAEGSRKRMKVDDRTRKMHKVGGNLKPGDAYPEACLRCRSTKKKCVKAHPQKTNEGEKLTRTKSCGPCALSHKACSWDEESETEESSGSEIEVVEMKKKTTRDDVAVGLLEKLLVGQRRNNELQGMLLWEKRRTNDLLEEFLGVTADIPSSSEISEAEVDDLVEDTEKTTKRSLMKVWAEDRQRQKKAEQRARAERGGVIRRPKGSDDEDFEADEDEEEENEEKSAGESGEKDMEIDE